jgi:hypothetical protein
VTLFKDIVAAYRKPMRVGHWRKSTNDREGSQCRNYDPDYGAFLK